MLYIHTIGRIGKDCQVIEEMCIRDRVVVGAVCNAPQLAPVGELEGIRDVGGSTAV